MEKPAKIFDRDFEWSELTRFVTRSGPQATLGVVSGRRRQGKTFLLDELCQVHNGFYFQATEGTEKESLRQLGAAIAKFRGQPAAYQVDTWDDIIELLFGMADRRPTPVVIDEFPFLVKASPALPSIIQRALGPQSQRSAATPIRLLLCGSALSFMGSLLAGNAPLRGRASLELVVPTLDYRLAAQFWGITDPQLAAMTNAIVGGTPAYRKEYVHEDTPRSRDDFDDWVTRTVLSPASPLFREARYLLAEESDLQDTALYHAVLAAIAEGNATRGGIANYLGRKSSDLSHPLAVLQDVGLISRHSDVFRENRSTYQISEPLVTFYHAVMRPEWGELERPGRATRVWQRSQERFNSIVMGPHFEELCRMWTRWFASGETVGEVTAVGNGIVHDSVTHASHELDVVALGRNDDGRQAIRCIGEAKWNATMGLGHSQRLRTIRDLLQHNPHFDTSSIKLVCFSGAGFTEELVDLATTGDVLLVDLDRLYFAP